jgi:asparagine synthase (glutamine-hydrolysing)
MTLPERGLSIVFNGEIYNYLELRHQLEDKGHRFRSKSDTEVLLGAFSEWGTAALSRLIGMFAFAILDVNKQELLLARDHFGIKPLYYVSDGDTFAFASELKALLEVRNVSREVNAERLYSYLRYGLTDYGAETLFAHIRQIPPAHYLIISLATSNAAEPVRYWEAHGNTELGIPLDKAADQLRELFLESVRLHLRSDVPVGAALSGGIDSSSIVMAMHAVDPSLDVRTFSYVAADKGISEEKWVDIVTKASRADVHKIGADPKSLMEDLDIITYFQDIPFGSTSSYAQFCIFRRARERGVKVMLDGQGADEILAGYRPYMGARLASLLRQKQWAAAAQFLTACSRWPGASRLWLMMRCADYMLPPSLQDPLRKLIGKDFSPAWLCTSWFRQRGVRPEPWRYSHSDHVLHETLAKELTDISLPQLLRYEDRSSMAFSIESRVPFLTPRLVEFLRSLPEQYLIAADGTSKAVFRRAMHGIVPTAVLDRRDKIGFQTPETDWLRGASHWIDNLLSRDTAAQIPAVNAGVMQREWQDIKLHKKPAGPHIWRWANLIRWSELFNVKYN